MPSAGTASAAGGEWLADESDAVRKESEARAKLAEGVTIGIERTLKSFRQFGVRHKTSQGFVVDGVKRISIFHDAYGELPLSIVGSDVLYDGQSIYSDQELRTSYPFLLFRDGIQRVIFEKGVDEAELKTFCTLLRDQTLLGNQVALEDDLVTLLWDANLAHLRYVVSESFKQEDSDVEREAARRALIEQIKAEAFRPVIPGELSAKFVRTRSDKDEQRAKEDLSVAAAWERGNQIVGDDKAREALVSEIDTDDVLLRKFLEIVFVEILSQPDPAQRLSLTSLVRDFAVEATRRDRLAEAISVLKALGDLARQAGDEGRKVAQEIVASIATPEVLRELMHQLQIADELGTEQLLTFLALMPARESKRMVPLLGDITITSRRRAICQLLAARLGDDLASIGEHIRDSEEGLALDLIYLLKASASPRARVELLVTLDSGSLNVRKAGYDAIRSTASPNDPTLIGASLLSLEDPDPDLRRLALLSIPRQLDSEVARRLRMVISREVFDAWDYYDKRRAYLAYASAAGKKAGKELTEVLVSRGMFSGDALEDRRCAAAFALASLGDEASLAVLEGEQKRMFAGKRIKEACEAAISMLKFKKPMDAEPQGALTPLVAKDDVEVIDIAHLPGPIWEDVAAPRSVQQRVSVPRAAPAAAPPRGRA